MKPILLALVLLLPLCAIGQDLSSIQSKTKSLKMFKGYFTFYLDENLGKVLLELTRIDTEFLYTTSLPAGLGSNEVGLDRGVMGRNRIVRFIKMGRKIFLTEPNYGFRASTANLTEKLAVEQSFALSTLGGFAIEAQTGNTYLIDITDFLLRDAMNVASLLKSKGQGDYSPDKSRSGIHLPTTKNFPKNTEFETFITYTNTSGNSGDEVEAVAPSPEAITLRIRQSFIQLPDSGYRPRRFDPRAGYFNTSYYDYGAPLSEPLIKYVICRHRLQKQHPEQKMSRPVRPIVYYLDNATPVYLRSAILDGAGWWKKAFEAAGFIDAFRVEMLPDSADPMDVRYNVINWVHRTTNGWSIGRSVRDPRTGEIIKGSVTLGSMRDRKIYLLAEGLLAPYGYGMPPNNKMSDLALARIAQLAAHEIGHTLGLRHNFFASSENRASVMDYPHPRVTVDDRGALDLSSAYADSIGAWDKAAINWGYRDFGGSDDSAVLNEILSGAFKKGLRFFSDEDAGSTDAFHPYTHRWDNGASATGELRTVMHVRQRALDNFGENNIRPGMPMATLEDVLLPVYLYHRYQIQAAAEIIGALNYNNSLRSDGRLPTQPVNSKDQLEALDAIADCMEPTFLLIPERITKLIPPTPAGFRQSTEQFSKRTGAAFDFFSPAEAAVNYPLSILFGNARLNRVVQYESSGGIKLAEMLKLLLDRTWRAPRRTGDEGMIQMQTEQLLLTHLLAASVNDTNSYIVRAKVRAVINELQQYIRSQEKATKDETYRSHLQIALSRIDEPGKAKVGLHKDVPVVSPIGCEFE